MNFLEHSLVAAYQKLLNALTTGYSAIQPYTRHMLFILLGIDLVLFGIAVARGKHNSLGDLVMKMMVVSVSFFIIFNFQSLAHQFQEYLVRLMGLAGRGMGAKENINTYIYNPALILDQGLEKVLNPLYEASNSVGGLKIRIRAIIFLVGAIAGTCFLIVTLQLIMAVVEFHLVVLVGSALLPFTLFAPLAFIGKRVYEAVIAQAIKIAVVGLISSISVSVIISAMPAAASIDDILTLDYLIQVVALSCFMAVLAFTIPAVASALVSGAPGLSMQAIPGAAGVMSTLSSAKNNAIGAAVKAGTKVLGTGAKFAYSALKNHSNKAAASGGSAAPAASPAAPVKPNLQRDSAKPLAAKTPAPAAGQPAATAQSAAASQSAKTTATSKTATPKTAMKYADGKSGGKK
jgi:type IV secretion system protein TrbL